MKRLFQPKYDSDYIDATDSATQIMKQAEKESLLNGVEISKSAKSRAFSKLSPLVTTLDMTSSNSKKANRDAAKMDLSRILRDKKNLEIFSQDVIIQAIIRTRTNQVRRYARPAKSSLSGAGYEIIAKDPKGAQGNPSEDQKKAIDKYEKFIFNCGNKWSPQRQGFGNFISGFVANRYIYDQINVERVFADNKNNSKANGKLPKLDHFNLVDAGTVVFDDLTQSMDEPRKFKQYPSYSGSAAIGKGISFTEENLTFSVYNNQTSVDRMGYGYPEVEAVIDQITAHKETEHFNALFFHQGGTTKGILVLNAGNGTSNQQNAAALAALRRSWQSNFSGTNGAWKMPVIAGSDAKFINLSQSSKDMEFEKWLNYLINIICAVFQIQPDEINFPNRGGSTGKGAGSSVNEGSTSKSKMKQSQDKGLEPLLNYIEDFINNEIMPYLDDDYLFRFTIGDLDEAVKKQELLNWELKNGKTLNEARAQQNLPELPKLDSDHPGDIPGGPAILIQALQYLTSKDQVGQYLEQHKNNIDPQKADHNNPEAGMPLDAVGDNATNSNNLGNSKDPAAGNSQVDPQNKP